MPVIERQNTIIQKFTDYVAPPTVAPSAEPPRGDDVGFYVEPEPEHGEDEEQDEEPEPFDSIDALLEEIEEDASGGSGHIIQVYRLPNYKSDGRIHGAQKEYCGDLPATLEYLTLIRDTYDDGSGNTYHCTLKDQRRKIVRRWPVTLARTAKPARVPATAAVPLQQAPDAVDEVLKVAERYKKLRAAFFPDEAAQAQPAQQPAQQPAGVEPLSIEERIVNKIIDRAEGDVLDRLVEKYVGGGGTNDSWMGIAADLFKPYLPTIFALIAKQQGVPAPPPPGEPAGAQTEDNGEDGMELIDDVLIPLLNEVVTARAISEPPLERAASSIRQYQQRSPLMAGFIAMLRESSADVVIGLLVGAYPELRERATRDPLVKQAIEQLQAKLKTGQQPTVKADS